MGHHKSRTVRKIVRRNCIPFWETSADTSPSLDRLVERTDQWFFFTTRSTTIFCRIIQAVHFYTRWIENNFNGISEIYFQYIIANRRDKAPVYQSRKKLVRAVTSKRSSRKGSTKHRLFPANARCCRGV